MIKTGVPAIDILIKTDVHYGGVLGSINIEVNRSIDTARVTYGGMGLTMEVNDGFLAALPEKHAIGVIKHEVIHIVAGHLDIMDEMLELAHGNAGHVEVCMEVAVNEIVGSDNLPAFAYSIGDLCPIKRSLARHESVDYYIVNSMPTDVDKATAIINGKEIRGFDKPFNLDSAEARAAIYELSKKAMSKSGHPFNSLLPNNRKGMSYTIDAIKMESLMSSAMDRGRRRISRPSRRTGQFPGYSPKNSASVAAYIDVSSSMSEEMVMTCIDCIDSIYSLSSTEMRCHYFSGEIINDVPMQAEDVLRDKIRIGGGTSFERVGDHALSSGYDKIVVLTDGECNEPDSFDRVEVMYVIIGERRMRKGSQINILAPRQR